MNQTIQMDATFSVTHQMLAHSEAILAALKYANFSHSFDDIVASVLAGRSHFYPLTDASFALMEVRTYPNLKEYHCFLAGGKLSDLIDAQEMIAENGRKLGCSQLSIMGRRGFGKALTKHGWKETHVRMVAPIA